MPPPQRLHTGLRAFVCRSCSSKLIRQPWLSKNISDKRFPYPKGGTSKVDLHFFEQYPDGTRTEVMDDEIVETSPEDDALGEAMMKRIEEFEGSTGKSIEELADGDGLDFEAGDKPGYAKGLVPPRSEIAKALGMDFRQSKTLDALADRLDKISDIGNLSQQQRARLRADILDIMREGEYDREAELEPKSNPADGGYIAESSASRPSVHLSVHNFPASSFSKDHRVAISNLRKALIGYSKQSILLRKERSRNETSFEHAKRVQAVGKAYVQARKALISAPLSVPPIVWSSLWNIFESVGPHNPDRMAHIKRIGEDMDEIGAPMLPAQHLLYIEAVFLEGRPKAALKRWEEAKHLTESDYDDYWDLGLRMLCHQGLMDRSAHAAEILLHNSNDTSRYRSLIPMIEAYLKSQAEHSLQRAWAIYIRLRANLGKHMTMADYDSVISSFMQANQPELALAVFRDMMLTNDASVAKHDSISIHKANIAEGDLTRMAIAADELAWNDPSFLSVLPYKFKNKFFFGSWVKKLIGDGDYEAAKQVLDLMQTHGIQPSPMHINGLIGAWFREGSEKLWDRADELAWRMIRTRLDNMKIRNRARTIEKSLEIPLRLNLQDSKQSHKFLALTAPATIETFTLLIREYRQRQKPQPMSDLFEAWRKSQIPPNTRFMNQVLLMDLRGKHKNWAWETYHSMTETYGVRPDLETFLILWNFMKRYCDPIRGSQPNEAKSITKFPSPRRLFAEMVKYKASMAAQGEMPRELYDLVTLSFSLAQDQAGTAIALKALRRHFKMYPNDNTARQLVLQLSRLGLLNEAGYAPRRLNVISATTQERIGVVANLIQKFREQRIQTLCETGIIFENMSKDEKLEETLIMFSDLLRHVAQTRASAEDASNNTIVESEKAALQMGVPDCVTWTSHS